MLDNFEKNCNKNFNKNEGGNCKKKIREVGKEFGFCFRKINIMIEKIWANHWKNSPNDEKVTSVQGATLRYIIENNDRNVFQKDIEKKFNITGATATNILKNLEKRGMIIRTPLKEDGRLKKITVTQSGYDHDKSAEEMIIKIEEKTRKYFTDEEQILFLKMLDKCIDNLEELMEEEGNE
ncbi:DNA-binding transcriptional regulator, MarR family [Lachnospiraceae bacterium C7]|nr:DNA-binding transcriptional regulator, MarR family [Lachnospiraceae bacterium C7]